MTSDDHYVTLNLNFKAIRVMDKQLIPTTWTLKTGISWGEEDENEEDMSDEEIDVVDYRTQLALLKIRYWFNNVITGGVLFSRTNTWALRAFVDENGMQDVQNQLIVLPDNPVDTLLAEIFQSKMNAFAGNEMFFEYVDLTADDADGFSFLFAGSGEYNLPNMEEWIGERSYFSKPWWARDDASTIDVIPDEDADLKNLPNFAYSLDFLGDGMRDIKKPEARIIRPEFKPEIINGGKH
jgi:hypothetical protein